MRSGLYDGLVVHERLRPRRHRLRYRVFSLLIDLDELPLLGQRLKLLGVNRWGVLSFHEKDHGDGGDLRAWIGSQLARAGIEADGRIEMLTYPRMFGYVFNPLTVYYCHARDGALKAILYEVSNTFGGRHAYVLPAGDGADTVRHACDKQMYVSPFMPMECRYNFVMRRPGDSVQVLINEDDGEGRLLTASFSGKRKELSDGALFKALVAHPLMTLKILAGIHVEALKLFVKGVPYVPRQPGDGGNCTPSGDRRAHHATGDHKEQAAR